jgi:SAM-dependent methyltransferase
MSSIKGMSPLASYPWPSLPGATPFPPIWDGNTFRLLDQTSRSVLTYAENTSHWSEELTSLHEEEGGNGEHPIDLASRKLALRSVEGKFHGNQGIVLDVGCSSGFFLRDLRAAYPAQAAIGADYIVGPLQRLVQKLPGTPLLQFDLRCCPLPSGSIDAVVCLNVLEHIDDDRKALTEIYRILKPDGIAHIEVPAGPSCYDIYDEHLMHHRRYTMSELREKALTAGFQIQSRTHLGAFVFPAFYAIKRRNRRWLTLPPEQKAEKVRTMMRSTRQSPLVALAMKLELGLHQILRYPVGIRCVVCLRK